MQHLIVKNHLHAVKCSWFELLICPKSVLWRQKHPYRPLFHESIFHPDLQLRYKLLSNLSNSEFLKRHLFEFQFHLPSSEAFLSQCYKHFPFLDCLSSIIKLLPEFLPLNDHLELCQIMFGINLRWAFDIFLVDHWSVALPSFILYL
mgnify:CR=1 FL=1